MNQRRVQYLLTLISSILLALLCLLSSITLIPFAQSNPTEQRQTIDILVLRRFLQTTEKQFQPTLDAIVRTSTQVVASLTAISQTKTVLRNLTRAARPPQDRTATALMEASVDKVFNEDLTATAMPTATVPLKSEKYLDDISLISQIPCGPPCFRGITVGKTAFSDALAIVKADARFSNVQSQNQPPSASWSTANGEPCCLMNADPDSKLVNVLLIKLKPQIAVKEVIAKYGTPSYVTTVDYSADEVAVALIFPKVGLVTWITPGDAQSSLKETDPVVTMLYIDPGAINLVLSNATLYAWNGYLPYQNYKNATAIVTPKPTSTP